MGAGIVCFQRPGRNLVVRVGREDEGVSSLRLELDVIASTLQATSSEVDLLHLCDSEAVLNKVSLWIGSGPRTKLAGDANANIKYHDINHRMRGRESAEKCTYFLGQSQSR
jgi:hypothetical protein